MQSDMVQLSLYHSADATVIPHKKEEYYNGTFQVAADINISIFFSFVNITYSQVNRTQSVWFNNQEYQLYPQELDVLPDITSPFLMDDGIEVLIVELNNSV